MSEIDKSIEKWQGLRDSERDLRDGMGRCGLCRQYIDTNCVNCPLHKIGCGCLTYDSNWRRYDKLVSEDVVGLALNEITDQKLKNKLYRCILTMLNDLARAKCGAGKVGEMVYLCSTCRKKLGLSGPYAVNEVGRKFCKECGDSEDDLEVIRHEDYDAKRAPNALKKEEK